MKKSRFTKRILASISLLWAGICAVMAQQTVSGVVLDANSEPIIGASVLVKGTNNGAVTDLDGNFSISVRPDATLVISCIGYVSQEVAPRQGMTVVLQEDFAALDELIVVGYGVQRKSSITGSISKVDEKEMQNRTITSAAEALGGKTSGVQILSAGSSPGANPVIRVRGYSSNYSSEPLYIVDGLKMRSIGNIDANDIESMEVLKDAASAAIYGAEAGNGVVLITTKKASAGRTRISYDFQYTIQSLIKKPDVLNAAEYIDYYKEAGYITDDMLANYYDGRTSTNWADVAFENSLMSKHALSFESSNDKSSVLISLNYLDNDGIVVGDKDTYKRLNASVNADISPYKWLKLSLNANLGYSKMNSINANQSGIGGGIMTAVLEADPLAPVYFDTIPAYAQTMLDGGNQLLKAADGRYYGINMFHQSAQINPLIIRDASSSDSSSKTARVNFSADIKPFKGMTITSRIGGNYTDSYSHSYSKVYYASAWSNNANPTVQQSSPQNEYWQWENIANYLTTVGGHSIGVMAGTSFSENISKSLTASINDILKDQENYAWIDFATGNATKTIGGVMNTTRKLSYFGRVNYDYKNRYILEASLRADAADLSILPKAQRWGYFPAASVGWVVTNEPFMPQNETLTFMKLRASWGQNGSIANLGNYRYAASITSSNSNYPFTDSYSVGAYPNALGNLNLKWETSEQLDFGLDLRFLSDRLSFSADYYIKKTKDLLITGSTPSLTAGNTPSPINAGNVENKGLEIDLSWKDHIGELTYSVSANLSTLKNRVTYLDPTIDRLSGTTATVGSAGGGTYFEVGYPVWYMRGYTVNGIDKATGNPVFADLNNDGTIDANDLSMIGSGIPKVNTGLTINLAYKGFDMVVFGSGAFGGDIWYLATYNNVSGANVLKYVYNRRWTASNTDGEMARPMCVDQDKYYASTDYIFSGNYFKIKQVRLGYTVPNKYLKKTCFSNVRAYLSLDDFFCFTNYPGLDPETATLNTTNGMGLDTGSYPSSKKVVLGFNVSF